MVARRRLVAVLLAAPLVLPGCGWTPLYADPQTDEVAAEMRAIKVYPILERVGQRLETLLRASLNPDGIPTEQRYLLRVTVKTVRQDLGVQSQGLGTRGEVQNTASFALTDLKTGGNLLGSTIHTSDSFDIQANGYSTLVAEDDARVRTVEQLRREIIMRLTIYLQRRKAEQAKS